jgi:hypothetical protein
MTEKYNSIEENKNLVRSNKAGSKNPEADPSGGEAAALATLQQQIGNRAVQRLLAQRSGDGPFDLDDETAGRINNARGSGQSLDGNVQAKMADATGHDFSGVKVHTGPEAHALNESLSAKAFTTGNDIFFREGAYNPGSSSGQELLAHELTHVVQQSSGRVGNGGSGMTVNAPGDAFEQEADSVARAMSSESTPSVQRDVMDQDDEEELGNVQTKSLQLQENCPDGNCDDAE